MSISVIDWLREKFFSGSTSLATGDIDMTEYWNLASSLYVRELAFRSTVSLIAKALAKCEFKTYQRGKEVRGENWYLWNVEPNRNQNSSVFINKLVDKLFEKNEALVIQLDNGEMLVADDYAKDEKAVYDYKFTQVKVNDWTFPRPYYMSEVLFFQLNNRNVKDFIDGLHSTYGQLAEYSQKAFKKSRGQKGVLSISSQAAGQPDFEEKLRKMMNDRFKPYFDADSAVLPLTNGYTYTEGDRKTYSSESTRDIRAQIDDVFVFTGRAFGVPPALLLGDVADTSKATDSLLTFCLDPLADMINEEYNRKVYKKAGVLRGDKLVIDTKAVKHIDLMSVATAIDKLISSGAYCVNDIRSLTCDEPINEPWAYKHWMTRNYLPVEQALQGIDGGEETE